MIELENNIPIFVITKKAQNIRKNMRYAHFAEICRKFGNERHMWKSHIRVFLTSLDYLCFLVECVFTDVIVLICDMYNCITVVGLSSVLWHCRFGNRKVVKFNYFQLKSGIILTLLRTWTCCVVKEFSVLSHQSYDIIWYIYVRSKLKS